MNLANLPALIAPYRKWIVGFLTVLGAALTAGILPVAVAAYVTPILSLAGLYGLYQVPNAPLKNKE